LFKTKQLSLVLTGVVLVRLLTLPGYPILDRTEARYAYIGELMVQTGNWITPFFDHNVPFWAKPILSFWLTAVSFSVFGINAFAARLPAFLIFASVCWMTFVLGRSERGKEFGLAAACIFASMALAFYLGGTVMTDPALMLGITLTMTSFWKTVGHPDDNSWVWKYLFFIGVSIGALAKGPIAILLPGLSIALWITQHRKWSDTWRGLPWITGTALTLVLVVPWYVLAEIRTPGFLRYFFVGEHFERFLFPHWSGDLYGAGRGWPKGTIWLFGLVAALPWSVALAILLFRRKSRSALFKRSNLSDPWLSYLLLWLLAPLVVFTFAANVLITYVAPGLCAFALLCACALRRDGDWAGRYAFAATAAIVPLLFLAAVIAITINPGARYIPTEANIYAAFRPLKTESQLAPNYVFNFPYSAKFYSSGQAKYIRDEKELAAALDGGERYFVIPMKNYPTLSGDLKQRLEIVTEQNGHLLLRSN
jgi:4-amino-4-deoxy-L-arabinose transferase-like glycosyltransferase